jgi:hypothetical protein
MQAMNKYTTAQFIQDSVQKYARTRLEHTQPARAKHSGTGDGAAHGSLTQYKHAQTPLASALADAFGLE